MASVPRSSTKIADVELAQGDLNGDDQNCPGAPTPFKGTSTLSQDDSDVKNPEQGQSTSPPSGEIKPSSQTGQWTWTFHEFLRQSSHLSWMVYRHTTMWGRGTWIQYKTRGNRNSRGHSTALSECDLALFFWSFLQALFPCGLLCFL